MKERSCKSIGIDLQVCQDTGYRERMDYIKTSVLTLLIPVCLECENKRFAEHSVISLDSIFLKIRCMRIAVVCAEDIRE